MRFGLVHRVMTDALAALGVLAVVSTASLQPVDQRRSSSSASPSPSPIPESWQGAPALRHFATIAPLALLLVAGRAPARRALAARRRGRVRRAAPDRPPRDAARRRARPADHRPRAAALRRGHRARRRAHLRHLLPRLPRRRARARSSSATCGARSRATTARARAIARACPVDVPRILRSRRVVGRGFLGATCLLSVPILLFTTALFVLFPRVGLSLLLLNHPHAGRMIGFSEHVDLGDVGVLRDDPTIALRFEVNDLARPAADAPDAAPARHGVRRLRRARLGSARSATCSPPSTASRAATSIRIFRGPDPRATASSRFDLEPIDPPVVFLPPRAVALRVKPPEPDPARRAARRSARRGGRASLRRLGRARPALRRLPRARHARPSSRRSRAADRARYLALPADLPDAHRRRSRTRGPTACPTPEAKARAIEDHLRHDYALRPQVALAGQAAAGRPLPLRVQARALRVLLDGDGAHAAHGRHPVAQRDRLRRRHVEPLRAATTPCARATRTRGSRRTSTTPATRAGRRSTRRLRAARSRSSRRAASTTTCATSSRRSRSAGTRTSSATISASRCASSTR